MYSIYIYIFILLYVWYIYIYKVNMVVDMLTSPQESVRSPAVALAFALRHLSGFGFGGGKILGNAMETMGKIWENMGTWDGKWDGNGGWNKHVF
jgi:hypothetical protein